MSRSGSTTLRRAWRTAQRVASGAFCAMSCGFGARQSWRKRAGCTTLPISPLKNAKKLNEIGERLAEEYQVSWLASDFKKKNGYKRSIELSAQHQLYRQDYCGCVFSKEERERAK